VTPVISGIARVLGEEDKSVIGSAFVWSCRMSVSLLSLNIPSTKPPFLSLKQGRMPDNLKNGIQLTLIPL
jgi:hypothetical protein